MPLPNIPPLVTAPFGLVLVMSFIENFVFAVTKDYICLLGSLIAFLALVAPLVLVGSHQDQIFYSYIKYGLPGAMTAYPIVMSVGLGRALQSVLLLLYVAPMSAMLRRTLEGRVVITKAFMSWSCIAATAHIVCTVVQVANDGFAVNKPSSSGLVEAIDITHGLVGVLSVVAGTGLLLMHSHRMQLDRTRRVESILSTIMHNDNALATRLTGYLSRDGMSGSTVNIFDVLGPPNGAKNPLNASITTINNTTTVETRKGSSDETLSSIASSTMNTLTSFGLGTSATGIGAINSTAVAWSPTPGTVNDDSKPDQFNLQIPGIRSATVLAMKVRTPPGTSITNQRNDVEALLDIVGRTPFGRAVIHGDLNNTIFIVWTMSVSRDSVLAAMNAALTIFKDVKRGRVGSEMSSSGSAPRPHCQEPPAMGIAQGTTMLGEFGGGPAKGFRVLGTVVQRASLLMQLAEYHNVGIVCDTDSFGYSEHTFVTRPVDIISTQAHPVEAGTVYEVVGRLEHQGVMTEGVDWQYELDKIEQQNPVTDVEYREGFRLMQEHQYEEAAAMFAQHCASVPNDAIAHKMHKRCLQLAESARLLPADDLKSNKWHARVVQPSWAPVQGESDM